MRKGANAAHKSKAARHGRLLRRERRARHGEVKEQRKVRIDQGYSNTEKEKREARWGQCGRTTPEFSKQAKSTEEATESHNYRAHNDV